MTFAQIIEFRTTDIDAVRKIDEDWLQATEGKRTVRRQLLARDHGDPDRYFAFVFFDSYELAHARLCPAGNQCHGRPLPEGDRGPASVLRPHFPPHAASVRCQTSSNSAAGISQSSGKARLYSD